MKTINLAKNVNIHIHNSTKFNDITISFRFRNNITQINKAARTFLTQLLSDTCRSYPTKDVVTKQLDTLYGTHFKTTSDVVGCADILEFRCSSINGKYVGDYLFAKQFDLMYKFMYEPRIENDLFDESLFEEIRERLLLMIHSYHDQPGSHASDRSNRLFSEKQARKALIREEEILACTNAEVVDAYRSLISIDQLDILILGDVHEDEVMKCITNTFTFSDHASFTEVVDLTTRDSLDEVIEKKAINQTRTVLTFTTLQTVKDNTYPALLLANGLFGGLPSSFLFQEVREKRSLCYSISSRYDSYDGLITVQTAIDGKNYEQVKELVLEQCNRLKKGDFSDEQFETTRKMYLNILRSSCDNQKSTLMLDYRTLLFDETRSVSEIIKSIQTLSKDDLVQAFQKVEPKFYYCLMQEDVHEEN